jgi:hypothetical protein
MRQARGCQPHRSALPFALPFLPSESDVGRFRVRHRRSVSLGKTTGQYAWRTSVNYEAQFIHAGQTFFFNDGGYTELSANVYYEYITDSLQLNRGDPAAGSRAERRRRSTRP